MEYSLSKFNNKFIWTTKYKTYPEFDMPEDIAFGYWNFSIEPKEIKYAMTQFDDIHNTVFFSSLGIIEDLGNTRTEKVYFDNFGLLD